jgi:hypothetical protein
VPNRTPEQRVEAIAELLGMALSTVSAIPKRMGTGRVGRIGLEPAVRYERSSPGELVHIHIKKLGRIEGGAGNGLPAGSKQPGQAPHGSDGVERKTIAWSTCTSPSTTAHTRPTPLPDEKAITATRFLRRALAYYRRRGIQVERILTGNGSAYDSAAMRSPAADSASGKAERFIRTCSPGGRTAPSTAQATNAPPSPVRAGVRDPRT